MMNGQTDLYLDHRLYESSAYQQHDPSIPKANSHRVAISQCVSAVLLMILLIPLAWAGSDAQKNQTTHSFDSRNLSFMRLSLEQGLSQSTVNAIVQDNQGYIWFGTQEGLNRYDGYKIQIFEHVHKDLTSLSNDWIWSLLVDSEGVLWVGSDSGGLSYFDPEQNTFTSFRHNPKDINSISHDRVRVIYQDYNDIYWVGTDGGGLNRFDPKTNKFERFQHNPKDPNSLPSDSVLSILEDRGGNLWVGTKDGLAKMDRRTGKFVSFLHDPELSTSLSDNQIRSLYEDKKGQLWIGTYEAGLNLLDPVTGFFKHFQHDENNIHSLSNNRVRDIFQDSENTLWIATDNGLNQWMPESQDFTRYHHDSADPSSLNDNRVTTLFQDRGGVMWVGTFHGINKWNYVSDAFTYYQKYGSQLKLSSNIVTSVTESGYSKLWVSTYGGGLNRLDRLTGKVTYYRHDPNNPQSLSDDRVMSTFIGPENTVWIGTRNGGLDRLDLATDTFAHFVHDPKDPTSLSANGISSILAEADGKVWVGTYGGGLSLSTMISKAGLPKNAIGGGLNMGDAHSGQFKTFRHDPADSSSLSSDRVLKIFRARSGELWIGTEDGGLNRFDEQNQTFVRYQHNPNDPLSLSNNAAWDILESSDGTFWIGTGGGGLNRWLAEDRKAGRAIFKSYHKKDGLHSNTIQGILEDNAGYLWLSSNHGLQRFDPKTGEVREYDRTTGLKGNNFNTLARFKNHDGRLYFGGATGVVAFYPNKIRTNQHKPDIILSSHTRLDLSNNDLPQNSKATPSTTQNIARELSYKEDLITFEFAGLDFTAPEKNLYRYKLEGFDDDWTAPAPFKRTTYTNLPAGDYIFKVMASNNDGIWNEHGKEIKLKVIPPPWKTGWAYALYTLIAFSLVVSYLRAQAKKLRQEVEQRVYLEEQVQLRTHEIAERNDELQGLNKLLKDASVTDTLTGLNNRRYMDEFIDTEVAQANRLAKGAFNSAEKNTTQKIAPALSFMMIDLDGFKAINDTYGHHAGDQALIQVRDILYECCRESDTIIRWGGDEFLIVSRNANPESIEILAERIRMHLADHIYQLGGGNTARLSGSIGFALYPFSLEDPDLVPWEQVANIADRAAYVAKENGRNAWVGLFGTQSTTSEALTRIKHDLGELVAENSLRINSSIAGDLHLGDQKATPRATTA